MLAIGVRSRRGAAGVAALTGLLTLADALLVAWARFSHPDLQRITVQWINAGVAFSGDSRFQTLEIDITFRISHLVLALVIGLSIVFVASVTWQRLAGRQEQGTVRSQVAILLLLLCAVGTLISGDLATLFAFWAVAGVASHVLLGHRWGSEADARGGALALALPFVGDLALLCAVGLVYSRFGVTDIDKVVPMLGATAGVGQKSTAAIAVLIVIAVAVRSGVWPFSAWHSASADAPPALAAIVIATWPLLAGHLLVLSLPFFGASGPQPARIAAWLFAAGAVAGPVLGLATLALRRTLVLASSGAVAVCLLAILYPGAAAAAMTGLIALAGARAALLLASGSIVPTMRALDLRLMGEGLRRMPLVTIGLGVAAAGVGLGAAAGSAWRGASPAWIAPALAMLLAALAVGLAWGAVALPPLPHRRAFEPTRIRDVGQGVAGAVFACAALSVVAGVLAFIPAWTGFAIPSRPAPPSWTASLLWIVPAAAGVVVAVLAMALRKTAVLGLGAVVASRYSAVWRTAVGVLDRSVGPGIQAVIGIVELRALPALESDTGRGLAGAGALLARGVPYLPAAAGLALVLGLALGLIGVGSGG
jgi:NADH:ubiquinone oxidoreductase subunit 5 (subunit L)/multisubunit Na+/H+ antiporter MnhA subunit